MQSLHLVGEDEDDVYSGFNEYNPAFDTEVSDMILQILRLMKIESLYTVVRVIKSEIKVRFDHKMAKISVLIIS